MDINSKIKVRNSDISISVIEWSSTHFTVILTPEYGCEILREKYDTFDLAMDRFSEIVKKLHKEPYSLYSL